MSDSGGGGEEGGGGGSSALVGYSGVGGAVSVDDGHVFKNYAVDYVRGQVYTLSTSMVLHIYNISGAAEISEIDLTAFASEYPGLINGANTYLACFSGGNLYIYIVGVLNDLGDSTDDLCQFNPDSQSVTGYFSLKSSPSTGDFPCMMLPVPTHGAGGNYEYILAIDHFGPQLINGMTGNILPQDTTTITNLNDGYDTMGCVGAQSYGSTTCYLLNYALGNSTMDLYSYEVYAGASSETSGASYGISGTHIGTLSITDFDPTNSMGVFIFAGILFDPTDENLLIYASNPSVNGFLIKWSASSGVLWRSPNFIVYNDSDNGSLVQALSPYCDVSQGTIGFANVADGASVMNVLNTNDGSSFLSNWSGLNGLSPGWQFYNSNTKTVSFQTGGSSTADPGTLWSAFLGGQTFGPITLAAIITDICERCTLTSDQIDVSELGWTVNGFVIQRNVNGKDALKILAQAFPFDCVESDYKLKFVPRNGNPIASVLQQDMAPGDKKGEGNYWEQTRASLQDIPTTFQVKFTDSDNYYLPNIATAKRINAPVPTVKTKQKQIIDLPMGLNLSDATVIAQTWLQTLWVRSSSYSCKLGWKFSYLDPTDNIGVFFENGDYRNVVVTGMNIGADYTIEMEMDSDNFYVYSQAAPSSNAGAGYAYVGTPQSVSSSSSFASILPLTATVGSYQNVKSSSYGRLFLFNLPLLQDQDDQGGKASTIYYAVGGYNSNGFGGGTLLMSADGQNYNTFDYLSNSVTWGICTTILQNTADPYSTDNVNTLRVMLTSLADDSLESVSYLSLMNGANPLLVGNEIIQYENVVVNTDGSRTFSGLLRGRRGTEWACGTHVAGEAVVVLDKNVYINSLPLTTLNSARLWKLVPLGAYSDSVTPTSFTFTGADMKPYMPVNFFRAASGSDLVVSWSRQTRLGGGLMEDIGTVPLGEETENYDAYILSAPYNGIASGWKTPSTFVRAITGLTSPTFTYTAAEMTADSFTPSTGTLHVVVFQNSATVGHGWPGAADLNPF
jgi:hypothetical protein